MRGEEEEGFEDWDADFLDQLIQAEELALSSTTAANVQIKIPIPITNFFSTATANVPIPITNSSSTYCQPQLSPQEPPHLAEASRHFPVSYSPPRHLSQRISDFTAPSSNAVAECVPSSSSSVPALVPVPVSVPDDDKELEICNLKRELGRVSKQLKDLEHECVQLRNNRDNKEEQLKAVFSNNDEKVTDQHGLKSTKLRKVGKDDEHNDRKSEVLAGPQTVTFSKAIGEQGERAHSYAGEIINEDLPAFHDLSRKLKVFWVPKSDSKMGQNLVSELLLSCETDFQVLFGCIGMKLSSKLSVDSHVGDNSSDKDSLQFLHGPDAIKVSNLYTALTKVSNGISKMEALFTPLLDLCNLDNVVIVHRSLHILHMFLKRLLGFERKSERRKTVMVEGLGFGNNLGSESTEGEGFTFVGMDETHHAGYAKAGTRLSDAENVCKNRHFNNDINLVPRINWVSLFEVMHQVAKTHCVECVRLEALSIMNLILMRNNVYMEREKFGQTLLFGSVLEFIRKESGLCVQKHAVRLLFLILNCPTFLVAFCSGCKEGESASAPDDNVRCATGFQKFSIIIHGLADCLAACGYGIEELQLRRNAVLLLAFLSSSGKAGFEILINSKLSTESNFLMLILQIVVSEVEQENKVGSEPIENLRERALLIREVLILLNRLASHSLYSPTVLRVLTNNRDMANLTIDVITKLSGKRSRSCHFDSKTRQIWESEVSDLAQVFKKRVFTYLGNSIL